ncbi:thioesterase family protein [Bordetella sp. N]|uniref:acyl-CoA thioesterase n=1 Tax=Bordetella sp. N TaxID=1746199 RepID=UPI00070D935A|nr:acyl-CoA thioesterase [Bordetella sp. N]ALM83906.1 thioesterase [Bordetella sp. N]
MPDSASSPIGSSPVAAPLAPGATHVFELPLRWGDSDALNHLNNTLYFRLMEEARMQILYGADLRLPADDGPILAHASCDFLRPLTYPATVRVTHTLTRIGRSSMEFELVLDKVGDEEGGAYARGRNVLVWMDYVANRSAPWPAATLAALARVMRAAPEDAAQG